MIYRDTLFDVQNFLEFALNNYMPLKKKKILVAEKLTWNAQHYVI